MGRIGKNIIVGTIFLVILLLLIFVYWYLNFINIKTNNYAMAIRK